MRGTSGRGAPIWSIVGTMLMLLAGGAAHAQVKPGEQDYRQNCAVCHGPTGKGDGEAVYVLAGLKPPDLSQLSRANGGSYPANVVFQVVAGRDDVPAHHLGPERAPLWKLNFETAPGQPNPTGPANVRARMTEVVEYIRTLQR